MYPSLEDRVTGEGEAPRLDGAALTILIDGEQRLLAVFDARQDRADAKLAAAATGALAIPAATLALASAKTPTTVEALAYGADIVFIIFVLMLRFLTGEVVRARVGSGVDASTERRRPWGRRVVSSESVASAAAREAWWSLGPSADPLVVQVQALELWRTRAQHSRQVAQRKEKAAGLAGAVFAAVLLVIAGIGLHKALW
ncbi:MAG TPA: hypothetical protein VFR49_14495 [Solirubrobacteraceae bacterium]|nr:hypothetical protein [Solirubrobacteraceae bacterium]